MDNIYKKLEIKDYDCISDFLDEVTDRAELIEDEYDSVVIFGSEEFIRECMLILASIYDFNIATVDMCLSGYEGEYALQIYLSESYCYVINVEQARSLTALEYRDHIKDFDLSEGEHKAYTRVFLNQDDVRQDLVEYCLRRYDEVMLFGIDTDEGTDENTEDEFDEDETCGDDCPWYDECPHFYF